VVLVHEESTDIISGETTRRTSVVQVAETDRDQLHLNSYRKLVKKSPKAFSKVKGLFTRNAETRTGALLRNFETTATKK
jgi:hypothetical protein